MSSENQDLDTVVQIAREATTPHELEDGRLAFVVPRESHTVFVEPDESLAEAPARRRGSQTFDTAPGFCAFVIKHSTDATEIWATESDIVAVLNGHTPAQPGWGDYRGVLALTHSPEWAHWAKYSGQQLDQATFAEHIEEGQLDVVQPDAATMLELAQNFHATREAQFRSAHHLGNGKIGLLYDEETKATAGAKGDLEIPDQILLAIPVYAGEDAILVTARFRYRLRDGKLTLTYKLDNVEKIKREALNTIIGRVRTETSRDVFEGTPAAPVTPRPAVK
jgi:uncharacterized protein YfdQ (DUF2303 family)